MFQPKDKEKTLLSLAKLIDWPNFQHPQYKVDVEDPIIKELIENELLGSIPERKEYSLTPKGVRYISHNWEEITRLLWADAYPIPEASFPDPLIQPRGRSIESLGQPPNPETPDQPTLKMACPCGYPILLYPYSSERNIPLHEGQRWGTCIRCGTAWTISTFSHPRY
jgi:hypothetical protein